MNSKDLTCRIDVEEIKAFRMLLAFALEYITDSTWKNENETQR